MAYYLIPDGGYAGRVPAGILPARGKAHEEQALYLVGPAKFVFLS